MNQHSNTDPLTLIQTHKISYINGLIKRSKVQQMRKWLQIHGQNSLGHRDVIAKRLRTLVKREAERLSSPQKKTDYSPTEQSCTRYYFVMDLEATCDEPLPRDYPHEVIELPIVVVDAVSREIIDEFRELCRPIKNTILTDFCVELTGITQKDVDSADTFAQVFPRLLRFLAPYLESPCALVTDSPYDVYRFLSPACEQHGQTLPDWARTWINVRKVFSYFYKTERMNIAGMLSHLGMDFDGRPHCGLDDARNIAKILITLLNDDCIPMPNEGPHGGNRSTQPSQSSFQSTAPQQNPKSDDQYVRKLDLAMLNLKL